jgi:tetratricopeptide (TPR) repeat protein
MLARVPYLRALQGRALAGLKQTEPARAAFAKAVEQSQNFQQLVAVSGQAVAGLEREGALSLLEPLAVEPRKFYLGLIMARIELELKKYGPAISRLKGLGGSIPEKDAGGRLLYDRTLATAYESNRQYQPAADIYRRIIKDHPDDPAALNNLAFLLSDHLNLAQEALPLAERVARQLPDDPQVLDTLGWTQFKAGQVDSAYDSLRKSFDKMRMPANAFHLAEVLSARNSQTEAAAMYRTARELAEKAQDQDILDAVKKRLGS